MSPTSLVTKKEYNTLLKRQEKIEHDFVAVKRMLIAAWQEDQINPAAMKRWDKISRAIGSGKGRTFASAKDMRAWLKQL